MFICTWNPLAWDWDPGEYERLIADTRRGVERRDQWSTGSRRQGIAPGDDLILLRQGRERGLVGWGRALSEVFESTHYNDSGRTAHYVEVRWLDVVDPDERIATDELRASARRSVEPPAGIRCPGRPGVGGGAAPDLASRSGNRRSP